MPTIVPRCTLKFDKSPTDARPPLPRFFFSPTYTHNIQVRNYKVYVAREILHHGSLVHPYIVGLYEVFITPEYLGIAMEYANGGDLFRFVTSLPTQRLPEPVARVLFQQLILAVHYMHGRVGFKLGCMVYIS